MKTKIITLVLLCMCTLYCNAQLQNLYFISNNDCLAFQTAQICRAVIDVCGEDFLKEALQMQKSACVSFCVNHDSQGNVLDVKLNFNKIDIDDYDINRIKQYLISNNMRFAFCPSYDVMERPNGIKFICSDSWQHYYMREIVHLPVLVTFPGYLPDICKGDSTERLARYYEWLDKYTYPNCLPMCEPCGCNPMSEMTNDYIFQQLSIGDIMSYQLLNEYVHQTEEVKQKFLYELSHPQHCDTTIIERCANSIKESLELSDFEKQRMLKALATSQAN